jgi:LPXTG-motif cell wall-anchored protein
MKKLLTLAIILVAFAFPAAAYAHDGVDHSAGEQPVTEVGPAASTPPTPVEQAQPKSENTLVYAGGAAAIVALGAGVFLVSRKKKS